MKRPFLWSALFVAVIAAVLIALAAAGVFNKSASNALERDDDDEEKEEPEPHFAEPLVEGPSNQTGAPANANPCRNDGDFMESGRVPVDGPISSLTSTADGTVVAFIDAKGKPVRLVRGPDDQWTRDPFEFKSKAACRTVALSPDGKLAAFATDSEVWLVDDTMMTMIDGVVEGYHGVFRIWLTEAGWLACTFLDTHTGMTLVKLLSPAGKTLTVESPVPDGKRLGLAMAPEGADRLWMTLAEPARVLCWSLGQGDWLDDLTLTARLEVSEQWGLDMVALEGLGKLAVADPGSKSVFLFDVGTEAESVLATSDIDLFSLNLAAVGNSLVVPGLDGSLHVADASGGSSDQRKFSVEFAERDNLSSLASWTDGALGTLLASSDSKFLSVFTVACAEPVV